MKRYQAAIALALACAGGRAGELEDGLKAWEARDFATAHKIFSKLAAAGDQEAELRLGEMAGFGEGVPEDLGQSRRWLELSRAHGNQDAAAALAMVEQRAARKADIGRYTTQYDGAELALVRFNCGIPDIPAVSRTKAEIAAVNGQISRWYECYGKFASNFNAQFPVGAAIPPDIVQLMNSAELEQARARMDNAYASVAAEAGRAAGQVAAAENAWFDASERAAQRERANHVAFMDFYVEVRNARLGALPPPRQVTIRPQSK